MVKGYDNDPIMQQLLLDLQLSEGIGTLTQDWAKPHHIDPTLINGPMWSLVGARSVLTLAGANQSIRILQANSADLAFTTGDFSIAMWINGAYQDAELFARGNWGGVGGYEAYMVSTGQIDFALHAAGPTDYYISTPVAPFTPSVWNLFHFIRSGTGASTTLSIYINGVKIATTSTGAPLNPIVAATNFVIADDVTGGFGLTGLLGQIWVWGRALTATEIKTLFERERNWFGV
jgi:hypothetical protein